MSNWSTGTSQSHNGWTLSPTTGAHFFARPSHSRGHAIPQTPNQNPRMDQPTPNVVRWPEATPAVFSPALPEGSLQTDRPVPSYISKEAQVLFHLGVKQLVSANILHSSAFRPHDWLVAYAALTIPYLGKEHMNTLTNQQVLRDFEFQALPKRGVVAPLLQTLVYKRHWATRPPHNLLMMTLR